MPAAIFATDPTWTDKEVITTVVTTVIGVVGALATVGGLVHRSLTSSLRSRVKVAEGRAAKAQKLFDQFGSADAVAEKLAQAELVETERNGLLARVGALDALLAGTQVEVGGLKAQLEGLTAEREAYKSEVARLAAERDDTAGRLNTELNRIKKAVRRDGAIWTDRVLANATDFYPLDPDGRRTPIVSMLNLKGGVGKTTATANLAAALSHRGYRVLLIDLDLQGSLTDMFMTAVEQKQAYADGKLVGDFLDASFDAEFPNLMDYARPITAFPTKSMLVPTTDAQAYAETNLTVRWFLRASKRDPRFLLRRELQLVRVTGKFDVILLDCPPLLNVSCVNALAASDYVLVPVMPSGQATARVPVLLERLREFRESINPELKVLGVFANRTRGDGLTADEANRMGTVRAQSKDAWGEAVTVLKTNIKQSVAVRDCEDDRRTLGPEDDLFRAFQSLAAEVEAGLPTFCVPKSKAAAGVSS